MIDLDNEQLVTMAEATQMLPGQPNLSTLWRWRLRGVRGVKLETVMVGGKRFTSIEALRRFQARVTAAADGQLEGPRPTIAREAAIERAERALDELGA